MKRLLISVIAAVAISTGCNDLETTTAKKEGTAGSATPIRLDLSFKSVGSGDSVEKKSLHGAGGTFPAPLYNAWFAGYKSHTGVAVQYDAVGSGAGIKAISNKTVDFGASDAAMTDDQLALAKGGELFHVPVAFGAIVLAYNLPSVKEQLRLTPDLVAAIYLGEIDWWDDPALIALNPRLKNVHFQIVSIHRADGSGTTAAFTAYLSAVNKEWREKQGSGTSVYWPTGYPVPGNDSVADKIQLDRYSVGYVELGYAIKEKLPFAAVRNKSGNFISPDLPSTSAAAASASPATATDLRLNVIDPPGENAYPICTATYILLYHHYADTAVALGVARLAYWMTHDAQPSTGQLNYARVPSNITVKSELLIRKIDANGAPVLRTP